MRPVAGQLLGLVHVTSTQVPPPAGHSLTLYETHGPPVGGGVMVMAAVVGLVGLADSEGALQAGTGTGSSTGKGADAVVGQLTAEAAQFKEG